MKKIVFILIVPLTAHLVRRFFIQDLIDAGFDFELWDVKDVYFKNANFPETIERDYIKKFSNLQDVEDRIKMTDTRNTIFIAQFTVTAMTFKLYRLLSHHKCRMFVFAQGLLPNGSKDVAVTRKILKNIGSFVNITKLISYFSNKVLLLCKRLKLIRDYDVVFATGLNVTSMYEKYSKIVSVNYFDYDNYLALKDNKDRLICSDYCVFLDDNIASAFDYKIFNIKTVEPHCYYKTLISFFDLIEREYKIKVVIAAHPKSEYSGGFFGKREIYKYRTNELVKDCKFVIAHYSTSIAYAVLYKKPIIFSYTDEMRQLSYFSTINNFANFLNCNIYNIDSLHNKNHVEIRLVDLAKYDSYKYAYLTSKESEGRFSKDIVLNYLKDY